MANKKILFVDDDMEVCDLIDFTLKNNGYDTIRAENGREGYQMAQLHNPDLMITDIDMPQMNGLELCNAIRQDKVLHMTPIIMLTGSRTHPMDRIAGLKMGADDYILKPFMPEELALRAGRLLKRAEEHISVNPLTKLPGSFTLEKMASELITAKKPFTACYFDLNQFKAFNDFYGYAKGDVIIKLLASLIQDACRELGTGEDILIHIGGDDFILLTGHQSAEPIGRRVIDRFTEKIPEHYNETDIKRGYITALNRRGETEKFPLMSLCIAAISTANREITRYEQVVDVLCELKKHAKAQKGSVYLQDRRVR